jgi:hypothetical protein
MHDVRGISVATNEGRKPVSVIERSSSGVFIHEDLLNKGTYTVSHIATGLSIWRKRPEREAMAFYRIISAWPEWSMITNKADGQFLRPQVINAREEAQKD